MNEDILDVLKDIYGGEDRFNNLAIVANFKCEYCGKNIIENEDSFKEWHYDHIIPVNKGGSGELSNIAFTCRTCNINWKGWWFDPRTMCKENPSRKELIHACIQYVNERKQNAKIKLDKIKQVINNQSQ